MPLLPLLIKITPGFKLRGPLLPAGTDAGLCGERLPARDIESRNASRKRSSTAVARAYAADRMYSCRLTPSCFAAASIAAR
ncbi:hypothetical protein Smic_78120 [Streptomyces microflavus]|uniref:Uncharacterized protein n=1 Tax=Streptomyces microflavus TaxID=1919 RepID=A0A7J0D3D5_STRMI|nr:hypothetical protein Smic_78120 [Streptomyces microflavus]